MVHGNVRRRCHFHAGEAGLLGEGGRRQQHRSCPGGAYCGHARERHAAGLCFGGEPGAQTLVRREPWNQAAEGARSRRCRGHASLRCADCGAEQADRRSDRAAADERLLGRFGHGRQDPGDERPRHLGARPCPRAAGGQLRAPARARDCRCQRSRVARCRGRRRGQSSGRSGTRRRRCGARGGQCSEHGHGCGGQHHRAEKDRTCAGLYRCPDRPLRA